MDKITTKVKTVGFGLLAIIILLFGELPVNAATYGIKSLITPNITSYLGAGYNSVKEGYIEDNSCLSFNGAASETLGSTGNSVYYSFVNSKRELENKFLSDFTSTGDIDPTQTAKTDLTDRIVNNTLFSADKITLIACWKREDKRIYASDLPVMSSEAMITLKNSPKNFFRMYGNKYVGSVTLGKVLYIVYQADISNYASFSSQTKFLIKRAIECSFRRILGAKLSADETLLVNSALANISITSTTYGDKEFSGPYSPDDFQSILKNTDTASSDVISKELKDYSYTANLQGEKFYDISDYMAMARAWKSYLSYFNYITTNSRVGYALNSECRDIITQINEQLRLIYAFDINARFPATKEQATYHGLYNRYITEMQIAPREYLTPPAAQDKQFDLNLSSMVDVASIRIECIYKKGRASRQNKIVLFAVDERGNWSEVGTSSIPNSKVKAVTLYEGVKISDQYKIRFYNPKRPNAKITIPDVTISVSFVEKPFDIIWLQFFGQYKPSETNQTLPYVPTF